MHKPQTRQIVGKLKKNALGWGKGTPGEWEPEGFAKRREAAKRKPGETRGRKPAGEGEGRLCNHINKRNKQPCGNYALKGRDKCRIHLKNADGKGGIRDNPKKVREGHAKKVIVHGIYADVGLLADEYPVYEGITGRLGTLNEEINMARVKLRRCYAAQKKLDEAQDALAKAAGDRNRFIEVAIAHKLLSVKQVEQSTDMEWVGPRGKKVLEEIAKSKILRRVRDFSEEIYNFTKLIQRLEQARKELMENAEVGDEFVQKLADDLRMFTDAADKLVPVTLADAGSGNYPELAHNGGSDNDGREKQ